MIEEKGPWAVEFGNDKAFIESDDFTHDVRLYVDGDFESTEQRVEYAEEIAKRLNTFASRDAEVNHLQMALADTEALELETSERNDKLREQVKILRDAVKYSKHQCESIRTWGGMSWVYHPLQAGRIFNKCEEALAATEPK